MGPSPRQVSDSELEVLKVLWEHGASTVREVLERAGPAGRDWAYTTAQTLLTRLQEKGFVASEKRGRAHVYSAVVSRDDLLGRSLQQLAERVCDGASLPLLLNLVNSSRFSPDELRAFRELLDRMDDEKEDA